MTIEATLAAILAAQERTATAVEALLALGQSAPAVTNTVTVEETAKPAAKKTAAKTTVKADPPKVEEPETPEVDPLDEAEEAPAKYTEDDVRIALKDYREINGTDAVMAILGKHDAKGMGSLKPEHYAAVMAEVR